MMKKSLCLGIVGCPAGLYIGSANLKQDLNIGKSKDLGTNEIDSTEKIWKNQQKTFSINKDAKITITQLDDGKYGKKVKVGINCMNGDLIGWGSNFWAGAGSRTDQTLDWGVFRKTFEKGLKGILNLIFGCNYKEAIEEADYGEWYDKEKLGQNREDIAMVGIISRTKNLQENDEKAKQQNRADFEEIWKIFGGPVPSSQAKKRTPVTDTALEVWIHERDEYRRGGLEEKIQSLVRNSIARSLIKIILGAKWCSQKNQLQNKCLQTSKYNASSQLAQLGLENGNEEELQLDGLTGLKWNPGTTGRGRPDWTWEKLQDWKVGGRSWWQKVKEYLGQLSDSSYFYKNNKNLAKVLVTEIFKEIVGQQKFNNIKFLEKSRNCVVGANGLICPKIGLVWKK
ncbi:hypothetical protein [Mycoplasma parvum]|uniref:Uncharacterized protein n=1 Tax=Mycoplasma parvum str. Indiana TaxID=1403316 RepID=U5NC19_9MOLU|nr:hypothetical protein [Mycoplasma parvum]AGX89121.1 hypothetical protein PRV_01915 [Mycoplasma parvum str. Indiana]